MKLSDPLKTNETEKAKVFWIKQEQRKVETPSNFNEDQSQLNLQKNGTQIYECRGRIQGHYLIYIPRKPLLAERIAYEACKRTMHG